MTVKPAIMGMPEVWEIIHQPDDLSIKHLENGDGDGPQVGDQDPFTAMG